jgi:hypothetical protein
MKRRAALLVALGLTLPFCGSGCTVMDGGRSWLSGIFHDPSSADVEDKWAYVGQEARGNRRMEKQDPLDNLLWSDKAAAINRNLGYD